MWLPRKFLTRFWLKFCWKQKKNIYRSETWAPRARLTKMLILCIPTRVCVFCMFGERRELVVGGINLSPLKLVIYCTSEKKTSEWQTILNRATTTMMMTTTTTNEKKNSLEFCNELINYCAWRHTKIFACILVSREFDWIYINSKYKHTHMLSCDFEALKLSK